MASSTTFVIPHLETERLVLREFKLEDFEVYAAAQADPEFGKFVGVADRKNSYRIFGHQSGLWVLQGAGWWMCERKDTGEIVGSVGAFFRDTWPEIEIGWNTFRQFWGKGYAHEAASAAVRYSFEVRGEKRVTALVDELNVASIAVAEKLGMKREGETILWGDKVIRYARANDATGR